MQITQTRVALAVLVAALIVAAVWRMAPPAAGTAATAQAPRRGAQPVPAASAAPLVARSSSQAAVAVRPASVGQEFHTSDDLAAYVRRYAPQALTGNARAALYVGLAIEHCQGEIEVYNATGRPYEGFDRCRGFLEDGLPEQPPEFWQKLALAGHDPLAQLVQVSDDFNERNHYDPQTAQAVVDRAARSGDTEVYFGISNLPILDARDGFAWLRVACERGFDCRMSNPALGMDCVKSGNCGADETVFDRWGGIDHEEVVSRARTISAALDRGETPFVPLVGEFMLERQAKKLAEGEAERARQMGWAR